MSAIPGHREGGDGDVDHITSHLKKKYIISGGNSSRIQQSRIVQNIKMAKQTSCSVSHLNRGEFYPKDTVARVDHLVRDVPLLGT